jgi:hypothetical protein
MSKVSHLPYTDGHGTSVHSWKPCPPDAFAKLVHRYATECASEHGNFGLSTKSMRLDRHATASIYYRPKSGRADAHRGGVSTPVLMTVQMDDGRVVCFERIASAEYPSLDYIQTNGDGHIRAIGSTGADGSAFTVFAVADGEVSLNDVSINKLAASPIS